MIMNPEDLAAAGVFVSLSDVEDEAPPEAAGEEDRGRYSNSSGDLWLDMSIANSRFLSGIELQEEDEEEVGEGGW